MPRPDEANLAIATVVAEALGDLRESLVFVGSHDLEDIITVVDGRATLLDEVALSAGHLKAYLGAEFTTLMGNGRFLEALPGHLPGDRGSQQRVGALAMKLRRLAALVDGA